MSTELPQALLALWDALATDPALPTPSPSIQALFREARNAFEVERVGGRPLEVLDTAFAQVQQQNTNTFAELAAWVAHPALQARARGAYVFWALEAWRQAADKLIAGASASEAFAQVGRRSRGRPAAAWAALRDAVFVFNALRRRGHTWAGAMGVVEAVSGLGARNIDAYLRQIKGPDVQAMDVDHEDRLAACAIYDRGWDGAATANGIALPADLIGVKPLCSDAGILEDSETKWLSEWNALPDTPD